MEGPYFPPDQGTFRKIGVQFWGKVDVAGYTPPFFGHGRVKVGVDQSAVSVSRCKKVGTLLCRFLTRVYPVVSFTLGTTSISIRTLHFGKFGTTYIPRTLHFGKFSTTSSISVPYTLVSSARPRQNTLVPGTALLKYPRPSETDTIYSIYASRRWGGKNRNQKGHEDNKSTGLQ